jgi:ribosomal protein L24
MTVKRDFKRRVRQRQARTGESYMTARRRVLADRPTTGDALPDGGGAGDVVQAVAAPTPAAAPATAAPPGAAFAVGDAVRVVAGPFAGHAATVAEVRADGRTLQVSLVIAERTTQVRLEIAQVDRGDAPARALKPGISVVELVDVTDEAKRLGVMCRVAMFPSLVERIAPARVLGRLREMLLATIGDPETALLAGLALTGKALRVRKARPFDIEGLRRFLLRARAGLSGTFDDGSSLAFHVADGDGMVAILCATSARDTALELSLIDDMMPGRWQFLEGSGVDSILERRGQPVEHAFVSALAPARPQLFLLHQGRRHVVTGDEFVIGRDRAFVDLAIKDGMISRKHAAVVRRHGTYYLKDLGSAHGILYKGMRIDNKRIDEGDVFQLGDYEIQFTYRDE